MLGEEFTGSSPRIKKRVLRSTIEYLMHRIGSSEFTRRVYSDLQVTKGIAEIRSMLTNSGYILKFLKLYLIQPKRHPKTSPARDKNAYPIKTKDLCLHDLVTADLREYLDTALDKSSMPQWSPSLFDRFLTNTYDEFYLYTKKFVCKKMSFILASEKMEADDLTFEIMMKGIRGVLLAYPHLESSGHTKAFMKRSIHNAGINVIHHYAHPDRTRYIRTGTGHQSRVLSLTEIESFIARDGTVAFDSHGKLVNSADDGEGCSEVAKLENVLTIDKITLRVAASSEKKQLCFRLLRGHPDGKFSLWLRENEIVESDENNVDLFEDNTFDAYLGRVSEYLGVSVDSIQAFLHSLAA